MSESIHELVAMHGSDDPAPPMTGVPHRMARVIDKLLEKNPDNRFQSAAEALSALEHSLVLMTPASGIHIVEAGETNPSLGPFPANSSEFAHLADTPLPQSLVVERAGSQSEPRKRPSMTEEQRIAGGATMLASPSAPPAAAQSQHSLTTVTKPTSKLPLLAAIGGVLVAAVIGVVVMSGGDKPAPANPVAKPVQNIASEPTPASSVEKPAVADKPAVEDAAIAGDKPAIVVPQAPPVDRTADKRKPKVKSKTTTTVKPGQPKPSEPKPVTTPEKKPGGAATPF